LKNQKRAAWKYQKNRRACKKTCLCAVARGANEVAAAVIQAKASWILILILSL